jgi:hypothetical protein
LYDSVPKKRLAEGRELVAKSKMGAIVRYCGHNGCFIADVHEIAGANVVVASRPVRPDNIERGAAWLAGATHHIVDWPKSGYWRPEKGIFVVPKDQVKELQPEAS